MKYKKVIGLLAALLALAFFSVALVVSIQHGHVGMKVLAWAFTALSVGFGVVAINYKYPTAIAPVAGDVYGLGLVTAQVFMADTDLTAVITHSFGLSAQELVDLFPLVEINVAAGASVYPAFTLTRATNTITLTKPSAVGSGGTFEVGIMRPHTNQGGPKSGAR
jgi:hypothetical protein